MAGALFEWDLSKDGENQRKHGVAFVEAQHAFADPRRVIAEDVGHSDEEPGYWRKGKALYEQENHIHR